MNSQHIAEKGFTLLELLVVVAILSILAAVAIIVINPVETLREARDSQRISDLSTIKTAIAIFITSATSTPRLDNNSGNTTCENGSGTDTLYYSYPSDSPGAQITDVLLDNSTYTTSSQVAAANLGLVGGTGWIKVNLSGLNAGSPISNFPVDPSNTISNAAAVAATDLVYRYACDATDVTFEVNANLESQTYDDKEGTDGGNNSSLYEVGTKLTILGTGTDF